jgi:hypothetical protein
MEGILKDLLYPLHPCQIIYPSAEIELATSYLLPTSNVIDQTKLFALAWF